MLVCVSKVANRKNYAYSGPQLQTTTQKNIVKMEIDENPRKPEDQEVERGVWEETETSRGWLSHRLFLPLGGVGFLPKSSGYAETPNDDPYT